MIPAIPNIPALANQLREAADVLDRIAAIFAPPAPQQAQPLPLLPAPTIAAPTPRASKPARHPIRQPIRKAKPSQGGGRVWTEERNDVLRRDWPAGVPSDDIRAALNRLDGPNIPTNSRIAAQAGWLGLHRPNRQPRTPPDDTLVHRVAPVAAPPAPVRPPASRITAARPAPNSTPIRMDGPQLVRWACDRGMNLHQPITLADVDACQQKASAIGHPQIEYVGRMHA